MSLTTNGTRAWALLLIARGATTDDLELDAHGFSEPLSGGEAQRIAEAAIRGDEATVTERVPSGLSRDNAMAICQAQR